MQVYTDYSGKIYLRGVSYAVYENNSWKQMPESSWTLNDIDVSWTDYGGVRTLTVRTPSHVSVM